jgi:hypothetical protein
MRYLIRSKQNFEKVRQPLREIPRLPQNCRQGFMVSQTIEKARRIQRVKICPRGDKRNIRLAKHSTRVKHARCRQTAWEFTDVRTHFQGSSFHGISNYREGDKNRTSQHWPKGRQAKNSISKSEANVKQELGKLGVVKRHEKSPM